MRAEALELAPGIVSYLLEDDDDELFFDPKDVSDLDDNEGKGHWTQIDGDWGDPWEYGGSWYNQLHGLILHFYGVESEEEVDPDDVEIPASMAAALERQYPSNYMDPDGDLEWQQRTRDDNERERDKLIGNYQYARAAYLNARKKHPFNEISVPDRLDSWMVRNIPAMAQTMGMTVEDFEALDIPAQMITVGQYSGFDQLGDSTKMSKKEASAYLGIDL